MKKARVSNIRFSVSCLSLGMLALASGGCSNHRAANPHARFSGGASARNTPLDQALSSLTKGQELSQVSGVESAGRNPEFSGTWLCEDSQCAPDTIKVISPKLDLMDSISIEHLPLVTPTSICRVHRVEPISITVVNDQDSVAGELSHRPLQLIASAENTHDCDEVVTKLNQEAELSTAELNLVRVSETPGAQEITINGIRFRKMSDAAIVALNQSEAEQDASISGNWFCLEPGFESLHQLISGDRRQLITESRIEFPDQQKCQIREIARLSITDDTDPQKLYATRTRGPLELVKDAENTEKCADILSDVNREREANGASVEQLTIERDGNQELIFQGKRFVRQPAPKENS